jgi:tetratricopeptide (TPR) repeat protein
MANYYWLAAEHKKSMAMAVQCLADAEKWDVKNSLPETYLIIGNLHKENTNYKMAFEAAEKGLSAARAARDTGSIISLLSLKAMFIHAARNQPHSTPYLDTSINIQLATLKLAASNIKYDRKTIPLNDNISQYYLNIKDYDKAIAYGEKGAATALKYDQRRSLTYSYSWLGMAWYFKGDRAKGLDYLDKALQLTRTLKEPYREMEIYQHLYDCYYYSADFKTALQYINRSTKMHDSLQVAMNEKQIGELQIRYESAKKDAEIAQMDRAETIKNKEIILISTGGVLFIVFFLVLYQQYRLLRQNTRLIKKSNEAKEKALENIAFIQAHELRKPVASVLGLINVIKASAYQSEPEDIIKLEQAAEQLDAKIRAIISHAEGE